MMTQQNNTLMHTDPAAVAAAETARARIQAAYQVALYKPRKEDQARVKILEACKRPAFASRVEYSKPVGGQKITGASIRYVEMALREWGNAMIDTQTIYEDDEKKRISVRVIDLETNTAFGKEIQISKTVERRNNRERDVVRERKNTSGDTVYIVRATEDEILNKESAHISKVIRTEGLRLLPQDITDEALATAKKAREGAITDPSAFAKQICDAFYGLRISPEDLEQYLGRPVSACSKAELLELESIFNAIKDGEAKWVDYVTPKNGIDGPKQDASTKDLNEALKGQKVAKAKLSCPDGTPADEAKCKACKASDGCEHAQK